MYTKHAEFKAGIVVLLSLGTFLGFLFLSGGSELPWAPHRFVYLRFTQGYAAPHVDDPVMMNGIEIGKVKSVRQAEETRTGPRLTDRDRARLKIRPGEDGVAREIYILVSVQMSPSQKIPKGTTAQISVSITGGRTLALLPGLSSEDLSDDETRRNPIPTTAAGDLTDVVNAVDELVVKFESVGDNVNLVLGDVRGLVADVRAKVAVVDLAGIQGNVLDASSSLKTTLKSLEGRVDEIATKVSDAAGNLKTLTAHGDQVVTDAGVDVKEILANLKALSADLKAIVARAGPKVDVTLDDVAAAAHAANLAVKEFQGLGGKVGGVVDSAGNDLTQVLEHLAQAGHNISDVTEDLKSHPWKLANRPEDKEIAFENLRNAASNYVRASEALQDTMSDLKVLQGRADLGDAERKRLLDGVFARLTTALGRYDEAAQVFTKSLQQQGAVQAPR